MKANKQADFLSLLLFVQTELSGRDVVVLRNVTHTTAGRFKCEVLADYPSFEKDSEFTHMEVIGNGAGAGGRGEGAAYARWGRGREGERGIDKRARVKGVCKGLGRRQRARVDCKWL